jgi:nicotinamide-nucleotide amidase
VSGVLAGSGAHWALAISGVAGPGGGSADKPVGTVWFAWGGPDGWRLTQRVGFQGDRDAVRRQAVLKALEVLLIRCREIS